MKKAYLAISYSNRHLFNEEIDALNKLFKKLRFELLVFVDKYNFKIDEEKEMMQAAFNEIDSSDILIAELTTKSIGVGIEIGYAFSKGKPIIYLRRRNAEYSTTAAGCSSYITEYDDISLLIESVEEMLNQLMD